MQLLGDVFENGACGFDDGGGGEKGEAEAQDLRFETIDLAGALDVAEQFERVSRMRRMAARERPVEWAISAMLRPS